MSTATRIKALREARGWSQHDLAQRVGVSQAAINKVESGITVRSRFLPEIARALGVPIHRLTAEDDPTAPALQSSSVARPRAAVDRDLPIYPASEGPSGTMLVQTGEPLDWVQRPWFLGAVRDGFAVVIVGDSMEPAFEPGDIAIVNPRLPPLRNKTVMLTSGGDGDFSARVARLVGVSAEDWHLQQFKPLLDFKLPKAEWPQAWRVVARLQG